MPSSTTFSRSCNVQRARPWGHRDPARLAKVEAAADAVRTECAVTGDAVVRGYVETRHKAGSWTRERRVMVRLEATPRGFDARFLATSLAHGTARPRT